MMERLEGLICDKEKVIAVQFSGKEFI